MSLPQKLEGGWTLGPSASSGFVGWEPGSRGCTPPGGASAFRRGHPGIGQRREAGCVLLPARGRPRQLPSSLAPGPQGEPVPRPGRRKPWPQSQGSPSFPFHRPTALSLSSSLGFPWGPETTPGTPLREGLHLGSPRPFLTPPPFSLGRPACFPLPALPCPASCGPGRGAHQAPHPPHSPAPGLRPPS